MKNYTIMQNYDVRKIRNPEELEQVYKLNSFGKTTYSNYDHLAQTKVMVVIKDGEIIGTNTFTADDIIYGLVTDKEFKASTDKVREEKKTVSAFYRFAIREDHRNDVGLLFSLLKASMFASINECNASTCVMTVPSGHEKFYNQYLGAEKIASKHNKGSDTILIRWDVEKIPNNMMKEIKASTVHTMRREQTEVSYSSKFEKVA